MGVDEASDDMIPEQNQPASDPYSVLNVRRGATDDEIQRSYKQVSRAFHPDKQPPGPQREQAQGVFVDFKNAHDVLTDPVLRQAYNDHGHYGVYFVRRSMHSSDASLFKNLSTMHKSGKPGAARVSLNEAMQFNEFQNTCRSHDVSCSIELKCNMLNSFFFLRGAETVGMPEVEKSMMSFSVSAPQANDWSMSFGGSSNGKNGEGRASGQLSVGYNPVQGTDMSLDVDIGEEPKVSIGTTRVMSTRTLMVTNISTIPQSDKFALSLSSHRPLFQNKIRGTWAIGLSSPDFSLHFGLLSFTTLTTKSRYTIKLNVGIDKSPLKVSADHSFSQGHTGHLSCGWGPSDIELSALMTRTLSPYAEFSVGVRHATVRGLTWVLRLRRGGISFNVPITVSPVTSPGYLFKFLYLSFLSGLIDDAVGDLISEATMPLTADNGGNENSVALKREKNLIELHKARRDARQQVELMVKPANEKRKAEEAKNGLVIVKATYRVEGGDELDATNQLQFWVARSSLCLPSSRKSNLLGFYDVRRPTDEDAGDAKKSGWPVFLNWYSVGLVDSPTMTEDRPMPTLTVRYMFQSGMYEVSVLDNEELALPCAEALKLGDSKLVS